MFLLLSASLFAQSFSKAEYPVGSEPRGIVTGDFNGDGVADVAAAIHSSNSISLLLGRGDGTFNAAKSIGVAAGPTEVTTADLDNDGLPDLIVAAQGAITILYMHNDGSATRFDYLVSGTATSVTTGDFNRDSVPDIAAVVDGKVLVLLNHRDESFTVSATLTTDVPASVVRASDVNRDGSTDIVIGACCQGSDVTFGAFFLAAGHGDGTFTVSKLFDQSDGTKLPVADVTRDGSPDLVIPYRGCHTPCTGVEVATNNGSGSFTRFGGPDVNDLLYAGPGLAVVADFNGDGTPEIATPFGPGDYTGSTGKNLDKVLVWSVGSDGKASQQRDYSLGSGVGAYALAVGDFNHDGRADLAVVEQRTGKVAVLLNEAAVTDFALTVNYSPQTVKAGDKASYNYVLEALNGTLPSITMSCSGLPTGASCTFDGPPTGNVTNGWLYIQTTPRTTSSLHAGYINFVAMILPFGFVAIPGNRRRRIGLVLIVLLAFAVMLEVGCGGVGSGATQLSNGSSSSSNSPSTPTGGGTTTGSGGTTGGGTTPPPAVGPTPAGTYQVTVTASGGGVTRTQAITLVVQ